jgi:hypothetical protein
MIDGDPSRFFWSNRVALPNDYVGVDLGQVREISSMNILMSKQDSPTEAEWTAISRQVDMAKEALTATASATNALPSASRADGESVAQLS